MNSKNAKTNAKFVGVVALDDTNFIGKTQKGITLIALVITIIVLLILAGVTINMVLGDDGIIAQAQAAIEKQSDAETLEIIEEVVAAQRINQLAGTGKTIDLEKVLKENFKADNVTVTEQNGEYLITVTKNGETKNYKVASNGKASKMEDGLIAYVEALKVAKGGVAGFDTIELTYNESTTLTAKGFNFKYNGKEYTYILENENTYLGGDVTIGEKWICNRYSCTSNYDIKNNIVTEFQGNVQLSSGHDVTGVYKGIILPSSVTSLGAGTFRNESGAGLEELKINGTLTELGGYVYLPESCIVHYGGNKMTSADFIASFNN